MAKGMWEKWPRNFDKKWPREFERNGQENLRENGQENLRKMAKKIWGKYPRKFERMAKKICEWMAKKFWEKIGPSLRACLKMTNIGSLVKKASKVPIGRAQLKCFKGNGLV